jgi:hypothetical protein
MSSAKNNAEETELHFGKMSSKAVLYASTIRSGSEASVDTTG